MEYIYYIELTDEGTYSVSNRDYFLYEAKSLEDAKQFIADTIMRGYINE